MSNTIAALMVTTAGAALAVNGFYAGRNYQCGLRGPRLWLPLIAGLSGFLVLCAELVR